MNAGETKMDHRPDVLVWPSHMKRRESTKKGVRELVCCFQPVLLSNGDGFVDAVSCHAGQASLLNQNGWVSRRTISLCPSSLNTSEGPHVFLAHW